MSKEDRFNNIKDKTKVIYEFLGYVIKGLFRFIDNHIAFIVLIIGLIVLNLGIYVLLPNFVLLTTGVTLVVLSVVLNNYIENSVVEGIENGNNSKKNV